MSRLRQQLLYLQDTHRWDCAFPFLLFLASRCEEYWNWPKRTLMWKFMIQSILSIKIYIKKLSQNHRIFLNTCIYCWKVIVLQAKCSEVLWVVGLVCDKRRWLLVGEDFRPLCFLKLSLVPIRVFLFSVIRSFGQLEFHQKFKYLHGYLLFVKSIFVICCNGECQNVVGHEIGVLCARGETLYHIMLHCQFSRFRVD